MENSQRRNIYNGIITLAVMCFTLFGCSVVRDVPDGQHLLNKNIIKTDRSEYRENIVAVIKQKPNRKILGLFRFHLGVYTLANHGKETRLKKWLKSAIGEEPVLLDTNLMHKSADQLEILMQNYGYFHTVVLDTVVYHKKRANVYYKFTCGKPYRFRNLSYKIPDSTILNYVKEADSLTFIQKGEIYSASTLQKERDRLNLFLRNKGYSGFNPQYIRFVVDTGLKSNQVDVILSIPDPQVNFRDTVTLAANRKHTIGVVKEVRIEMDYDPIVVKESAHLDSVWYKGYKFISNTDSEYLYKPARILDHIFIKPDSLFTQTDIDITYQRLADLGVFRFVNIKYETLPEKDSLGRNKLRCSVLLSPQNRQDYKLEAEGTNSGGNLGVSGNIVYRNKNMFKGAELFEFKIKGGLEIQRNFNDNSASSQFGVFNTYEFGPELTLNFPRALWPFTIRNQRKVSNPITSISLGYNVQSRPEYFRRLINTSYYYTKRTSKFNRFYFYPVEINYLKVDLDSAFEQQLIKLNDINLLTSYTDQLIANGRVSYIFNNQNLSRIGNYVYFKVNLEFAGNSLSLLPDDFFKIAEDKSRYLTNVRYAQYIRPDLDYRFYKQFNKRSTLVARLSTGLGYAYGNSKIVPFEKAFYAGGPNDIRAWRSRSLGPGSNTSVDYFERFGEFKLTGNVEYRFDLFRFIKGAIFTDMGNVWLINTKLDRPGGILTMKEFPDEIAIGSGLGIRADFTFFILRLDGAVQIKDPAMPVGDRWVFRANKLKDITFNFGIGYPF